MRLLRKIKNNRLVRALYFSYIKTIGFRKSAYGYLAENVCISIDCTIINPKNVFLYSGDVISNCFISALNAKFTMKKGCAVAGGLKVYTGNHARVIGTMVGDVTEEIKPKGYDQDVIVEDDVWIGSNVTLLSGVTVGRGTTVAAGAVVVKSMPPYCICGGVPAKFIKFYWTIDQILEHEAKLYPENERYTREQLEEIFAKYQKQTIMQTEKHHT